MKITDIRTFLMQAGPPDPDKWATDGRLGDAAMPEGKLGGFRNWLFVKVYTDAGIVGIGECSGWPRVIETAVQDLKALLIGEDPTHIERLWQKMQVATMGHGMLGTVGAGAMTGIDVALWDIKGKALGVPVWNLLGGRMRDRVPIYSHANTAEAALAVKGHGIRTIKCGGVADPVRKVATLREAVGDEVDIAIDLHGPPWLTPADAARLARALEPYNLLWIEDPIAPENLDGYKRIRDAAHVPLAAGERMATIFGERELIERELVDVIQPDTGRAGGLTQMRKIAAMAEAHHIMMAPHSGSLGPVAEYAALHLLAAIPNALILERLDADWPGRARTVVPHPVQEGGSIAVPDASGLGCDIDEDFVARFPSERNVAVPGSDKSYAPGTHREHVYVQTRLRRAPYFNGR
ncbi:mandelate racemase/muconate lactonizing enzyme family protein [Inquilinus limosus]|uniref:Isomerase n=1 Tax=Inquilinus limosus MP06 TaxID=1398085 RepID=A0A0A0DD97_9PROT|nr:mandelate racemase/muconate lactonizing enzyme family protein [Inquilinus limosus]KGM36005.1 isomerase [Inquilinus limosus MP06]